MLRLTGIGSSLIRTSVTSLVALTLTMLLSTAAAAQQMSGIAGAVRDTSGGVLPGVTVEARSPALIEQVRTVFTDSEGRYSIIDLRPGTYTVTFSLPGFTTRRQEGIQLTGGFTATVNADLDVGGIEETVTVTGASPIVDVQNVRRQQVATREVLDTLPTSTMRIDTLVTLTPGFTGLADVGGRYNSEPRSFHGKRGTKVSFDGMGIENSFGNSSYQVNAAAVEEMVLQTSGISAEVNADGPIINVIPKEGSNTFNVTLFGFYSNDRLESDNFTDKLRARGVTESNRTLKMWDESVSLGGPVKRDRLWYFFAARSWGFSRAHNGVYWNQSTAPGAPPTGQSVFLTPPDAEWNVVRWVPWVDRPLDRFSGRLEWYDSYLTRITWQAGDKHKFHLLHDQQEACNCGSTSSAAAQEVSNGYRFDPNRLMQLTWSSPQTSRLLFEAAATAAISHWNTYWSPAVQPDHINVRDLGLGLSYGSGATYRGHPNDTDRYSQRASVSYVTGSHNFKGGAHIDELVTNVYIRANGERSYTFRNGVPVSLTQRATPYLEQNDMTELGLFAQDQWTLGRLTLNLGVRFDYFYGKVPLQELPGTTKRWTGALKVNPWLPARSFAELKGVPSWKDINPRVGAVYDLFGDGRTALKVSLGRYVAKSNNDVTAENNPINTSVNAANRAWSDANRNYVPDCDLGNFAANGECGGIDNVNFGRNNPRATRWADEVLRGWGVRDSNWDGSVELQREVRSGLSMTVGYFRNTGGYYRNTNPKIRVTDNLAVTPEDFDPYCITAPPNPALPGGGGYQVCGLYDIKPEKFGLVENLVRRTSHFGNDKRVNNFFNINFDGRLGGGVRLGGGFDTGHSVIDRCFVVDSPQELLNCRVVTPFKAQTQLKLHGSVPLPGDVVVSAIYQNLSGDAYEANYAATNAEIASSLGRNLAGGLRTAVVPLVAPQTLFEGRIARFDVRLSKIFQVGKARVQANFDAYNVLNASPVAGIGNSVAVNNTYGPRWRLPAQIMDPRIITLGGRVSF